MGWFRFRRIERSAYQLLGALDRQSPNLVLSLNAREAREDLRLSLHGRSTPVGNQGRIRWPRG